MITSSFIRSDSLPIKKRIANLEASQARWVETYGEENDNLKNELDKLKGELNGNSTNTNGNSR